MGWWIALVLGVGIAAGGVALGGVGLIVGDPSVSAQLVMPSVVIAASGGALIGMSIAEIQE